MTQKQYLEIISREPLDFMVKDGQGYRYIPKSILQSELLKIFEGNIRWEMLRETVVNNGLWGTGRLEYKNPATMEWLSVTGTASLSHDKNMRLNFPNLEAHCMINACKKIGVWFGQTLNKDQEDTMDDGVPVIQQAKQKLKPDSKIMTKFLKAVEDKDEAAITMMSNIYEINIANA